MTFNRRSTLYTIDIPRADDAVLDDAIARLNSAVPHQGSGFGRAGAYLQFRAATDEEAAALAKLAAYDRAFVLRTGLGKHARVIGHRITAGCFCLQMKAPSACITCTCPSCGAAGRFGVSVSHQPGCRP